MGGMSVRVQVVDKLTMEKMGADGQWHHNSALIELRDDINPTVQRDTLLHECLHGVLQAYGIKHAMGWDDDVEEKVIRLLSPTLLALLRDNPSLVAYLVGKP